MWLFYINLADSVVLAPEIYVCLQDLSTINDPYTPIAPAGTINVCLQDISGLP